MRGGIHYGPTETYYGTTLNLAARVRAEAAAGEILLSETTATLVSRDLPPGYALVDLGPHHLKGIERPEAIKALAGPGLQTTPAAAECPYRGLLAFEAARSPPLLRSRAGGGRPAGAHRRRAGCWRSSAHREAASPRCSGPACSPRYKRASFRVAGSARLITPGAEPPLDLGDGASELLIVDQFEELYTQCHDADRREQFIRALLSRSGPVVIGVRADFYGEMSADAELAGAVARNQVLLVPMQRRRPASRDRRTGPAGRSPGRARPDRPRAAGRRRRARRSAADVPRAAGDLGAPRRTDAHGRRLPRERRRQLGRRADRRRGRRRDPGAGPATAAQHLPTPDRDRRRRRGHPPAGSDRGPRSTGRLRRGGAGRCSGGWRRPGS